MPSKKKDANDVPLVPEEEFKDAFRSILNAPKDKVEEQIEELHASNKAKRAPKKPTKK